MKYLTLLFAVLLTGCVNMGVTEYELEPIVKEDGSVVCCKATVYNSKDYDNLKFKFKIAKDGSIEAALDEKGVNSTSPASIGAENNGKMLDAINKLIPLTGG
jgi:hypothetical protein|tara:strand:- start:30387 stop:30692 length:306 start_codon:yes stop_codon:yes gene_type:complete